MKKLLLSWKDLQEGMNVTIGREPAKSLRCFLPEQLQKSIILQYAR